MVLDEAGLGLTYRCGSSRPVFGPLSFQQFVERPVVGAERILPPAVGCIPGVEEWSKEVRISPERETVDVHLEVVIQENRPEEFLATHRDDGSTDTDPLELRRQISREFRRCRVRIGGDCLDSY